MDLTIKSEASKLSITVELVKKNKRIFNNSEDDLIKFWIGAADRYIADKCNISLMEQTLVLRIPRVMPEVSLPRPPMTSIVSFKYTMEGSTEVNLIPADYITRKANMLPTLHVNDIEMESAGEMEVEYKAGFDDPTKVPPPLRQAALLLASHYVTSREATFMDMRLMQVEKKISFGVDQLIKNYSVPNVDGINGDY